MSVAGYVDHLRSGGTMTWRSWRHQHPDVSDAPSGSAPRGAAQLEVVRRLEKGPAFAELADRVLRTPAPGRGAVDIPLPGTVHAFGSPAVEPETLPARELIRLAAAVLADLIPAPVPSAADVSPRPRWWRRAPAVVVHGTPLTARVVRTALAGAGVRDGGRHAVHVIVAAPLEQMMAEHWEARVSRGGMVRWQRVWGHAAAVDRLPAGLDLVAMAGRLEAPRVVVAADPVEAARLILGLVGRQAEAVDGRPGVAATEALRWVNRARPGTRVLFPRGTDHALAAPRAHEDWARAAAARLRDGLAGYAVHGDAGLLEARSGAAPRAPDVAAALDLTLAMIGATWKAAL